MGSAEPARPAAGSRRRCADETGELDNADPESDRSKAEDAVGALDVFFKELDDPDNNIDTNDSYVNHYLLPMFGLPDIAGDLRHLWGS